jgi:CRP/FNR family transcriptional regulator
VFCDLDNHSLEKISEQKGCAVYKKNQTIFNENTPATGFYCVYHGTLKLYKIGCDGKEIIMKLLKPGDIIGYRALISNENYGASCGALEDAKVCFFPKSLFNSLIDSSPDMMRKFMGVMSKDLRDIEERFANWVNKPVRERLAEALILLNEGFGQKDKVGIIQLSLTREELANIVGTATETLIRCLAELKADKIINYHGKEISILNPSKLLRIANLY